MMNQFKGLAIAFSLLLLTGCSDDNDITNESSSTLEKSIVAGKKGEAKELEGTIVTTSKELLSAISNASAGENIYLREGNYKFSARIRVKKSGSSNNLISLLAHPDDAGRPTLDFSSMSEKSSNRGIQISGDYWYIKGIDIVSAGDNGMFISGDNNLIEYCTFSHNRDTGLQIGNGGSNNTILNCDSFFNADSKVENADGYACKLDAGDGNKFIGCRAWQNLDDGWDGYLRGTDNITTTYENCWAIKNGYLKDGTAGGGDGNGFKTGGSDNKKLKHNAVFTNCIAAGNLVDGFDHNSNRGDVSIFNCASYANNKNYNFSKKNIINSLIIKNSASIDGSKSDKLLAKKKDITNNSWQDGLKADSKDYISLDIDQLLSPRQSDGSLPDVDCLKLSKNSDLIGEGVDIGLPFSGSAPDIGVYKIQ